MNSKPATSLDEIFLRSWQKRGLLAWLLWPLSLLFHLLVVLRRRMYAAGLLKSTRLPVPVIVVGNIFIGGTGKTPLTIWLVQALLQAGYKPGVISRGYGADAGLPRRVGVDSPAQQVGDEPLLIAQRTGCPVVVGRNRVDAASALLAAHPDVDIIVSDDGLQHYALQRDIEIVLFDSRGAGNGWLLPAGPLREPQSRRRDFTVVNVSGNSLDAAPAAASDAYAMQLVGDVAEQLADRSRKAGLGTLQADGKNARIVAAAGIGNPARFFSMLHRTGLVFTEMPLPDHYDFMDHPFLDVVADMILITEKDAVKCGNISGLGNDPRIWVVPVTAQLDDALAEQIVEKCRGCPIA